MSVVAVVFGLALAAYLHTKWYYGGWMSMFGDPPADNPAYHHFLPLFISTPYIAAGFTAGLLSGFGSPQATRILIRSAALLVLAVFFALRNTHFCVFAFIPTAAASFMLSTVLSIIYFRFLTNEGHSTKIV